MSGWIASTVAAMVASRHEDQPTVTNRSMTVLARYVHREKTPETVRYSNDFDVKLSLTGGFEVIPHKVTVPAKHALHMMVMEYHLLEDAELYLVRDGRVLCLDAYQERNKDGEWDGLWQEITLSARALTIIEKVEYFLEQQKKAKP